MRYKGLIDPVLQVMLRAHVASEFAAAISPNRGGIRTIRQHGKFVLRVSRLPEKVGTQHGSQHHLQYTDNWG